MKGLRAKFNQNPTLKKILLNTGNTDIVEAAPHDTYWGIGLDLDSGLISDKANWRGKNQMGQLLTALREELTGQ